MDEKRRALRELAKHRRLIADREEDPAVRSELLKWAKEYEEAPEAPAAQGRVPSQV